MYTWQQYDCSAWDELLLSHVWSQQETWLAIKWIALHPKPILLIPWLTWWKTPKTCGNVTYSSFSAATCTVDVSIYALTTGLTWEFPIFKMLCVHKSVFFIQLLHGYSIDFEDVYIKQSLWVKNHSNSHHWVVQGGGGGSRLPLLVLPDLKDRKWGRWHASLPTLHI